MSKIEHEEYLNSKATNANAKSIQLARLQDAFIEQLRQDIISNDFTAIDEMFFQILKIEKAINHLIDYLPEDQQEKFLNMIDQTEL